MAIVDRILARFRSVARGAVPDIDYKTTYRAKVLRQHSNKTRLDLAPTDPRLPQMSNVPLKVGVPGLQVTITGGHFVLLGWENGRPDRPYASLWDPGTQGTTPINLTLHASKVELGGVTGPFDGVLTGQSLDGGTGLQHWMLGNGSSVVKAKP
jgi:hypothetical protein